VTLGSHSACGSLEWNVVVHFLARRRRLHLVEFRQCLSRHVGRCGLCADAVGELRCRRSRAARPYLKPLEAPWRGIAWARSISASAG
jgi:hypothetical protein